MYIGPWQEYVLGKALSQAKVRNESSRQRSRPVTASSDFMGGTAPPVRLPRPDSSLSAPSAVGYERHTLRAHPRQASGRGKAKPSQKGKKQRLAHMQQLYGLSGTTAATPAREGEAREGAGAGAGGGLSGAVAPSAHAGGALGPHTSSSLYSPQERGGRAEAVHAWGGGGGMEAGARLPAVSGGFAVAPMAAGSLEPGPWGGQADHHAPHWASAAEIRLPRVEAQHASAGWVGGGRGGGGGADLSRSGAGGDGFGAHGGQSPSRAGMTPTRRAPYQTTFTPFPQAQPHHAAGEPGAPPSPALQPRSPFGGMRIEPDGHGLRVDARADMRGRGYTHSPGPLSAGGGGAQAHVGPLSPTSDLDDEVENLIEWTRGLGTPSSRGGLTSLPEGGGADSPPPRRTVLPTLGGSGTADVLQLSHGLGSSGDLPVGRPRGASLELPSPSSNQQHYHQRGRGVAGPAYDYY